MQPLSWHRMDVSMAESSRPPIILFAEDVRLETSGQVSVIGLQSDFVGITEFPSKIERLAVLADCAVSVDDIPKQLSFKLALGNGDVLLEHDTPVEIPESAPRVDGQMMNLRLQFRVKPFTVSEPTTLTLAIRLDEKEVAVRTLHFVRGTKRGNAKSIVGEAE